MQGTTYSSNGCSVADGNWTRRYLTPVLSLPCSVEWEITSLSPVNTDAMYVPIINHNSPSSNTDVMDMIFASNKATINGEAFTMEATGKWRIELNNGTYSVYHNDTLVKSFTKTFPSNPTWAFTTGDRTPLRSFTFKNVKIKPL